MIFLVGDALACMLNCMTTDQNVNRVREKLHERMDESEDCRYASGQYAAKGDHIRYAEEIYHPEAREIWIVMTVTDDMVRAKCEGKELWRQAFFTAQMELIERTFA
jgi:hypothetical protein